jgi:cation:H+ antiporter
MWSALLILAGLAGLLVGAELLVLGSTALASRLGIRPIVIGLTVFSLGTSLPELAIGIDAARQEAQVWRWATLSGPTWSTSCSSWVSAP